MNKTLRNIALAAGIMGASVFTSPSSALAGDTGNLQRAGNATVVQEGSTTPPAVVTPPAVDVAAAPNSAPVWAEGLGNYTLTDAPVTFDLKANDADNDELVYVLPENWSQTPIEGGITVSYNGERGALGNQVSFTVSDNVNEPVGLDVVLSAVDSETTPVADSAVPTPEPYTLRSGFRLGAEYNFLAVQEGAQYNLAGLRATYDIPLKENILLSLNASAGYANQSETRQGNSSSTDELMIDSETGRQNLSDGQYLNWAGATYESSETSRTWEEGRNGGYAGLGANVEFGRQIRFVTGLEGRVMFGSFADTATDVTLSLIHI